MKGKNMLQETDLYIHTRQSGFAFWLWLIRSAATSSMWQRVLFFLRSCGAYRTCLFNRKLRILGHVLVLICFCSTLKGRNMELPLANVATSNAGTPSAGKG